MAKSARHTLEGAETGKISDQARAILHANDQGGYTVPTEGMYPYQWNWDSAFVGLGFAQFDLDRALRELESLFDAQWDTGMVPHIVFRVDDPRYFPGPSVWRTGRSPETSGITQPPVAASIALRLWRKVQSDDERARVSILFDKILSSHHWFHEHRDPDRLGVVIMTHPWESGRDNSPEWDAPAANVDISGVAPYERRDLQHADADMRPTKVDYDRYVALVEYGRDAGWDYEKIAAQGPFRVADVGMSMMLLRADRDLLCLARELDKPREADVIESWVTRGAKGVDLLWDETAQTFCSRDMITDRLSGYVTSASFLAFYANAGDERQRAALLAHWRRISDKVRFMVPSFDPDSDKFNSKRYWRGPCWAVVNFMITQGFLEHGLGEEADRVANDTQRLIELSGFAEAFDPVSGEGTGGKNFSWTAAMWLAWIAGAENAGVSA